MAKAAQDNTAQAEYWNSAAGRKWIDLEAELDAAMAPALELLLDRARLAPGESVLDIGCGTGATCLAAAAAVGAAGRVEAVDIAPRLLERARVRAAEAGLGNVAFTLADAASHRFAPPGRDAAISRFGAMFFADPVPALANIGAALRPGGRIAFVAWASAARNPWFAIARDAAVARLGAPPPADPDAPGPLGFQNLGRVAALLDQAGLVEVTAEAVAVDMTPNGSAGDVAQLMSRVGPAVRIVSHFGGTPEDAAGIEAAIAADVSRYVTPAGIRIPATLNMFTASAP